MTEPDSLGQYSVVLTLLLAMAQPPKCACTSDLEIERELHIIRNRKYPLMMSMTVCQATVGSRDEEKEEPESGTWQTRSNKKCVLG
jgi:hypothetical protein